jgi:hypothetical protein
MIFLDEDSDDEVLLEDEYQEKVLEKFSKFINQKLGDIKKVQIEELLFGDTEEINKNQDF